MIQDGARDVLVDKIGVDGRTRAGTRRRGFDGEASDVRHIANRPHARNANTPAHIGFDPRANWGALCLYSECIDYLSVGEKVRGDE
jgi:hypothetical protein